MKRGGETVDIFCTIVKRGVELEGKTCLVTGIVMLPIGKKGEPRLCFRLSLEGKPSGFIPVFEEEGNEKNPSYILQTQLSGQMITVL